MAATRSSVAGSATLVASPSMTMSIPEGLAERVQAGFVARLRDLRVPGPLTT